MPQLSDPEGIGAIENDSDIVIFLYRDDMYHPETTRPNTADSIVAKHRNGPVGEIRVRFDKAQTRFRDLSLTEGEDAYTMEEEIEVE